MLSDKMQDALNKHLNAELYSAYLYYGMAAYFEARNLKGMASWMNIQVQEELLHVQKFYSFILERGGKIRLMAVGEPPAQWDSVVAVFESAYQHECKVSSLINDLVDLAIKERDHATNAFLQWFVSEQVEEEASTSEVADKALLANDQPGALFMLDNELGQRTFNPAGTDTAGK